MLESSVVWIITIAVSVLIIAFYWRKFRNERLIAAKRREEAKALGIDTPRSQYPFINAALCIGCGSCVSACPEGDVLGVVLGTATIINGERCVGHGYCEVECPVGALKVGLGDVSSRPDIPVLSECYESTVSGLFIAGELTGISLIRNAVAHGKVVIEEIASRIKDKPTNKSGYDVIIVGAGPAGITAALKAQELKLNYLLIDQGDLGGTIRHYPRRKLVMTQPLDLPLYGRLKKDEYSKEFLMDVWHLAHRDYGLNFKGSQRLENIEKEGDDFLLTCTDSDYTARYVMLAIGRRGTPRQLGVDGEELPKVMYQLVDAQAYNGMDLLVVGGGDSAVEAAVGLSRQNGNRVTISYRRDGFSRVKKKNEERINEAFKAGRIKPIFNSNVIEITFGQVTLATPDGEIKLINDYVFIFAGGIPPYDQLKSYGINFGGEIPKEESPQPATATSTR